MENLRKCHKNSNSNKYNNKVSLRPCELLKLTGKNSAKIIEKLTLSVTKKIKQSTCRIFNCGIQQKSCAERPVAKCSTKLMTTLGPI